MKLDSSCWIFIKKRCAIRRLDRARRLFRICSHGSRDVRDRTQPWDGAFICAAPRATGWKRALCVSASTASSLTLRRWWRLEAELPSGEAGGAVDVPCLWESAGYGGF
jgi:hypothetical protein